MFFLRVVLIVFSLEYLTGCFLLLRVINIDAIAPMWTNGRTVTGGITNRFLINIHV